MRVEIEHTAATRYSHWAEGKHRGELMTGFENREEHVLPVTIDVVALLGHTVRRSLEARTPIDALLTRLKSEAFDHKDEARLLAAIDFKPRRIFELVVERLPGGATPMPVPPRPRMRRPLEAKRG